MPRYTMDFSIYFAVPTNETDWRKLSDEELYEAFRQRAQELLAMSPAEFAGELVEPEIFDHG